MINYAKWDNLDDSDSDGSPAQAEKQTRGTTSKGLPQQSTTVTADASREVASQLRSRGNTLYDAKDLAGAVDCYLQAARLLGHGDKQNGDADPLLAPVLLNAATAMLDLGRRAQAEALCADVLAFAPSHADALKLRAAAKAAGATAASEDPLGDGLVLMKAGKRAEAAPLLQAAMRRAEDHSAPPDTFGPAVRALTAALVGQNDQPALRGHLERASASALIPQMAPGQQVATWQALGLGHLHCGEPAKAADACQKALRLLDAAEGGAGAEDVWELDSEGNMIPPPAAPLPRGPTGLARARILTLLGAAQLKVGRVQEAVGSLTSGAGQLEGDAGSRDMLMRAWDNLSDAHARLRQFVEARRFGERALRLAQELGDDKLTTQLLLSLGAMHLELDGPNKGSAAACARWKEAAALLNKMGDHGRAADTALRAARLLQAASTDPAAAEEACRLHLLAAEALSKLNAARARPDAALLSREAEAWRGYACGLVDEPDETLRARRRVRTLQEKAPLKGRGPEWRRDYVDNLQAMALSAAQTGDTATAEQCLLDAIQEAKAAGKAEIGTSQVTALYKYLAIVRRRRGDLPNAEEALSHIQQDHAGPVEIGESEVQQLNRLLGENRIGPA